MAWCPPKERLTKSWRPYASAFGMTILTTYPFYFLDKQLGNLDFQKFRACHHGCIFMRYWGTRSLPSSRLQHLPANGNISRHCPVSALLDMPRIFKIQNGQKIKSASFWTPKWAFAAWGYRICASLAMMPFNILDSFIEDSNTTWSHPVCGNATDETNMTTKERCEKQRDNVVNHLGGNTDEGKMARWFYWSSLFLWAVAKLSHDWLLLWGFSDYVTLQIGLARYRFQQMAYLSGFAWSLSATEVFLAEPEAGGCPCYYELPESTMLLAFGTPGVLYISNLFRKVNLYKAFHCGDYLNGPSYHVPFRIVQASAPRDPDAPLLVAGMRGDPLPEAEKVSTWMDAPATEPHAPPQQLTLAELKSLWRLDSWLNWFLSALTRAGVLAMSPIVMQIFVISTRQSLWSLEGFPLQAFVPGVVCLSSFVSGQSWYKQVCKRWREPDLRTFWGAYKATYNTAKLLWCGIAPPFTLLWLVLMNCETNLQWGESLVNCIDMPLVDYLTVCACLTCASFGVISWYSSLELSPVKKLLDLRCFEGPDMSRKDVEEFNEYFAKGFPNLRQELGLHYHFAFLDKIVEEGGEDVLPGKALKLMGERLLQSEKEGKEGRSHHETQRDLMDKDLLDKYFSDIVTKARASSSNSASSYSLLPCQ